MTGEMRYCAVRSFASYLSTSHFVVESKEGKKNPHIYVNEELEILKFSFLMTKKFKNPSDAIANSWLLCPTFNPRDTLFHITPRMVTWLYPSPLCPRFPLMNFFLWRLSDQRFTVLNLCIEQLSFMSLNVYFQPLFRFCTKQTLGASKHL